MQLDFFYHNRTPSYASMSTISGHVLNSEFSLLTSRFFGLPPWSRVCSCVYVAHSQATVTCVTTTAIGNGRELHLLVSFHGISSPANNCRPYLYDRVRLEIKCYFLKLIS